MKIEKGPGDESVFVYREGGDTYIFVPVFHKRISARLAFERSVFVEEKIQFGNFAEFGEDLEERVSVWSPSVQGTTRGKQRAYSSTVGCKLPM